MVVRSSKQTEYSFLSLILTGFEVRSGAAINPELRTGRVCGPDTRILEHHSVLTLTCRNIDADEPVSDSYSFTIYGNSDPYPGVDATLADYQIEDENGFPKYRKHRGIEIPVYEVPKGLAVLRKAHGERSWSTALWLPRDVVSDMLVLLNGGRQLYAGVHLKHEDRKLWVLGFDLQTENSLY